MSNHFPISDLVCDARVLQTLDGNPPPMNFHADFNVPEIGTLNISNTIDNDFNFLKGGPA